MLERAWQGSGSEYKITWGDQPWTLRLDGDRPGLHAVDRPADHVLCLSGVAAAGRFDPSALSGLSLLGVERVAQRVEASFAPANWSGLQVRASWRLCPTLERVDLEVEAQASSVGELRAVEVFVATHVVNPEAPRREPDHIWVHPRDARSARLSYDGRVPANQLARLTTEPIPAMSEPHLLADCNLWTGGRDRRPLP